MATASAATGGEDRSRTRSMRAVLGGLFLLIGATTVALFVSAFPPCVPETAGAPTPPLAECAVSVGPWIALAVLGLLLAAVAYRRVP